VSVSAADYLAASPPTLGIDPYTFCVNYCMNGVVAWANKFGEAGPISYTFEAGHKDQAKTKAIINRFTREKRMADAYRYHSHSFVKGKKICGLAAADLLAWEFSKAYDNKFGPVRRQP